MAENNGNMGLGDLGMIRDILMGPQIAEINEKLNAIREELNEVQAGIDTKIQNLSIDALKSKEALNNALDKRLENIEKTIHSTFAELKKDMQDISDKDKAKLSKLLIQMGEKLSK